MEPTENHLRLGRPLIARTRSQNTGRFVLIGEHCVPHFFASKKLRSSKTPPFWVGVLASFAMSLALSDGATSRRRIARK